MPREARAEFSMRWHLNQKFRDILSEESSVTKLLGSNNYESKGAKHEKVQLVQGNVTIVQL